MEDMVLDVKLEENTEMQMLTGPESQEAQATHTNGDANGSGSANPHGCMASSTMLNLQAHAQHSHMSAMPPIINRCHVIPIAAVPTNLSHGNGCAASPTTSAAISTSSGVAATDNPDCRLKYGRVMTDEQFETLRRQISVYSTICSQLVEMHKALMTQQALMPNMMLVGQQIPFDPVLAVARSSGRQRWTPSQIQLQILENVFEKSNGTPSKQRIKEITAELGQHGSISETNVYNWFQNRKARAKRKQQHKDGESEVEVEEMDTRKDKRAILNMFQESNGQLNGRGGSGSFANLSGGLGVMPNTTNHMFDDPNGGAQSMHLQSQVDAASMFNQGMLQKNHNIKEFSTIVVLIDGKPWEVPSTTLDLKGSFGETSALLDSQRQVVPTDERGFTTCSLHAGESYTLIKLNNGSA